MRDTFPKVVKAVKTFARSDARRLLLRDQLRARAIASMAGPGNSIFVEAGYIHYPLYQHLRRQMGSSWKIRVVFLLEPVIKRLQGKRRNLVQLGESLEPDSPSRFASSTRPTLTPRLTGIAFNQCDCRLR